ncbi:MAG: sulfite exporter TauE/SafE family protein [Solirubrobacterales bacterium]|nr:sulfite exporter TauE/SafE family protein [Solirubrobacterales bacterium]
MLEALAIFAAGIAAGTINTVVGSGTLITFPTLLAFGYAPVTANVSNTIGLVPGSVSGAIGYRRELAGQAARARRLGVATFLGALAGAALLLVLPAAAFKAIVPAFVLLALVLVVLQPRIAGWLGGHRHPDAHEGWGTRLAVFGTGVYGGYFGAAQGIMLLGFLGVTLPDDLQRINALKNVLAGLANLVAGVVFALVADVSWGAAALIAAGSTIGGQVGARYGRRLPPPVLRAVIVVVGSAAVVHLVTS